MWSYHQAVLPLWSCHEGSLPDQPLQKEQARQLRRQAQAHPPRWRSWSLQREEGKEKERDHTEEKDRIPEAKETSYLAPYIMTCKLPATLRIAQFITAVYYTN